MTLKVGIIIFTIKLIQNIVIYISKDNLWEIRIIKGREYYEAY